MSIYNIHFGNTMFEDKKCSICGTSATNYLFGLFVCDNKECIEKARALRGGPAGHKLRVVSIGSKNPIKIKGVQLAMEKTIGNIKVVPIDVDSEVSNQPWGFEETTKGAINRAKKAYYSISSIYGVGIEAGLVEIGGKYLDIHICAIFDGRTYTIGTSQGFQIPEEILEEMKKGEECSKAAEKVYGLKDIGREDGIIGYLTNKNINRVDLCESAVLMAMVLRLSTKSAQNIFNK